MITFSSISELWMSCHTQEEIADDCECERHDVDNFLRKTEMLPNNAKPAADHLTDFDVPVYNVWVNGEAALTNGPLATDMMS